MKLKHCFLYVMVLILGCNSKTTSINLFCRKLDKTLSANEKERIRDCPDVGCLVVLVGTNLRKEFADAYNTDSAHINQILIDSFKINNQYDRERALFLAYQKELVGKSVDFFDLKNEMIQYDNSRDSIYEVEEKKNTENHVDIAKYNFNRFEIGDTLQLELSLIKSDNIKRVGYYRQYDKHNFNDTLFIKGVLLKKTKVTAESLHAPHDEYDFLVKIIEVSNAELNLVDKIYQKGNVISVPLYDYGRIINK